MFLTDYAAVLLKSVAVGQVTLYQAFSPYPGVDTQQVAFLCCY